jgi:hypothetical protein
MPVLLFSVGILTALAGVALVSGIIFFGYLAIPSLGTGIALIALGVALCGLGSLVAASRDGAASLRRLAGRQGEGGPPQGEAGGRREPRL